VVLIVIIVLTFVGVMGALMQVAMGQPSPFFGIMLSGGAARLASLFWAVLGIGVGVGLILMSRWGWWLAISQGVLSLLTGVLAIPHMDAVTRAAMQNQSASMPPEMMAMMESIMPAMMGVIMVFSMLFQLAIVAYLVWKRELFGIDVESPSEADQADGSPAGPPEPPAPQQ